MTPIAPGPRADNPQVIAPAGTVHVALADWARYISLHLRGARGEQGLLLAPESFEKLHARVASDDYALGWVTAERGWAKGRVLTHSGSNGSWFAVVWIAPNVDLAFLAVTNCGADAAARACDEAITRLLRKHTE